MALAFRRVTSEPLRNLDADVPDGIVIGVIGENGSGKGRLLRLAAGIELPASGAVERSGAEPVVLFGETLASQDALEREKTAMAFDGLRRAGKTVFLISHEEGLLRRLADEVWWLDRGRLAGRGDPEEVLTAYRKHIAERLRAWGEKAPMPLAPRWRRGDGRAEIVSVETIGENGAPTVVWRSGELAVVKVRVRFREAVADPVIGIMIRTRIGLNVYGTNTELEKLKLGPCAAGDIRELTLRVSLRIMPRELHSDGGLARSRRCVARLAGRRRVFRGQRRPLYRRSGELAGYGECSCRASVIPVHVTRKAKLQHGILGDSSLRFPDLVKLRFDLGVS